MVPSGFSCLAVAKSCCNLDERIKERSCFLEEGKILSNLFASLIVFFVVKYPKKYAIFPIRVSIFLRIEPMIEERLAFLAMLLGAGFPLRV